MIWTPELTERLMILYKGCMGAQDIAIRLGLTSANTPAVIAKIAELGLRPTRSTAKRTVYAASWTLDEEATLIAFQAAGLDAQEIGSRMCRSIHSITAKLGRLGKRAKVVQKQEKQRFEMVSFPQFEDITRPDRDRWTGRRKMPERAESLTGCATAWAVK